MTPIGARLLLPACTALETMARLVDELFDRNEAKAVFDSHRYATRTALGLYAKARKNTKALYLLALNGFGEDAMILARSLVNMCIDLRFVCGDPNEAETRARRWIARGRVGRRDFCLRVGTVPPDEFKVDWKAEGALAEEWDKVKIWQRAQTAGLKDFYDLPYRHGSTFEHSDSWSALSFLEIDLPKGETRLLTVPSARYVDLALLTACCALAQLAQDFGRFFDFELGGALQEMDATVRRGFPTQATIIDQSKGH